VSRSGAKRCKLSQMVAGGRYELYSNYPLKFRQLRRASLGRMMHSAAPTDSE